MAFAVHSALVPNTWSAFQVLAPVIAIASVEVRSTSLNPIIEDSPTVHTAPANIREDARGRDFLPEGLLHRRNPGACRRRSHPRSRRFCGSSGHDRLRPVRGGGLFPDVEARSAIDRAQVCRFDPGERRFGPRGQRLAPGPRERRGPHSAPPPRDLLDRLRLRPRRRPVPAALPRYR